MRGLLRTAYVRRITVQYLTVLLYDGNADDVRPHPNERPFHSHDARSRWLPVHGLADRIALGNLQLSAGNRLRARFLRALDLQLEGISNANLTASGQQDYIRGCEAPLGTETDTEGQ
jgi:hypothetical protein